MKKVLLILLFSLLLSGCVANYDVPVQSAQPYKKYPMIVETVEKQSVTNEAVIPVVVEEDNRQIGETNEINLSNDDSYINVDGKEVHSPAYSDSIPSNASAKCKDGTYSFSQHRQGTCSGHGGVAKWY